MNYARHRKTCGRGIQVVMHFLAAEPGGWHGRAFHCRKLRSEAVPVPILICIWGPQCAIERPASAICRSAIRRHHGN
jgi:hypothetical protein